MKTLIVTIIMLISVSIFGLTENQNHKAMKLNAGIITNKLTETKEFYTKVLNFGVAFENDFYLLIHTPNHQAELAFLLPNHPSQNKPIFQNAYEGKGMYITIEVEDVDMIYTEMKEKGVELEVDIRYEVWGDRHFAIVDPNGIGIDIVTYTKPEE